MRGECLVVGGGFMVSSFDSFWKQGIFLIFCFEAEVPVYAGVLATIRFVVFIFVLSL